MAHLTQEGLADRAGLSAKGIQKLERGGTQPYRETVRRLVQALDLTGEEQVAFQAAGKASPRQRRPGSVTEHALDVHATLPAALTSFIGREAEKDEIERLLVSARLVTLTGVGGCGKTRLALEVAKLVHDRYRYGVRLVELASLADPFLVPQAVATALRIREVPTQPLLATIVAAMRGRRLLLLLDNCEHLLDSCAHLVDTLLRACPELQVLVTSREAFGLAGEVTRRVPSLPVPPLNPTPGAEQLCGYGAVQLFLDRVRDHSPDFAVTSRNADAIAQVCGRLDGIPLALELAAALVRSLAVEDIAVRLDRRLCLLTSGSRAALPRQQTLRTTIDWSYDLLSSAERGLFSRLSVFWGRWTLESAENVCSGDGIPSEQIVELLSRLLDKSLVVAEEDAAGSHRYRLLDTLREYGRERLLERGELEAVQRKHAGYYLTLAKDAEAELNQPRQGAWIERLVVDQSDILAALEWLGAHGKVQDALRLVSVQSRVWEVRGQLREGRRRLAALLALPGATAPTLARAKAVHGAGVLALYQGDVRTARMYLKESLGLYRGHTHSSGVAGVLIHLGWVCHDSYRNKAARRFLEAALVLCRQADDRRGIATCLSVLGMVVVSNGDLSVGRAMHEEALALSLEVGDRWATAWALTNLGAALVAQIRVGQADAVSADAVIEEGVTIWQELGERRHLAFCQMTLAMAAVQQGRVAVARELLERCLSTFTELEDVGGTASCLANWADLFRVEHQHEHCVQLLAATFGQVKPSGRFPLFWSSIVEQRLDSARRALGQERFDAAWTEGYAMSLDEAVVYAWRNASSIAVTASLP